MASDTPFSRSSKIERIAVTEKQKFWILLALLVLSIVLLIYLNTTDEKLFISK